MIYPRAGHGDVDNIAMAFCMLNQQVIVIELSNNTC